jgi:XTP/dITP diphosphohydrolase
MTKTLVVASRNKKKIAEIMETMKEAGYSVISAAEAGADIEVNEDGTTFEQNSYKKAWEIMKLTGQTALADDSGLEVDALGGMPGVYSARFSGERATDESNNTKLLQMMKDIPAGQRGAKFVCTATVAFPDLSHFTVRGEISGEILFRPRGSGGFGYDPLFYVPEYNKTFAELEPGLKNSISHRARALAEVKKRLISMQKGDDT